MRRLPATTIDSMLHHRAIVEAKTEPRRYRLQTVDARVGVRMAALSALGPLTLPQDDLGTTCVGKCNGCIHDDLRHTWESSSGPLQKLKALLIDEFERNGPNNSCPYCGIDAVHTFDHHLPKDFYPEFSVAAANLVRACERCNTLKTNAAPAGTARFLDPVIDPLDTVLVHCEIDDAHEPPVAIFTLDQQAAQTAGLLGPCQWAL